MFKKPNYSHIAKDATVSIEVSAEEVASVFEAYDRGINVLDEESMIHLELVISKLKDQLWQ